MASTLPASTCSDAVRQARAALRRFREDKAAGTAPKSDADKPYRITIELPLPLVSYGDDAVRVSDEAEWPGGVQQRFRALRPLADSLLDGYGASFAGVLESEADGVGVWQSPDLTAVSLVSNATFAPFARLVEGEFGARPLQPDHTLLALNPAWTRSADIGQLWDGGLRRRAAAIIDAPGAWASVYCLRVLRTTRGAAGLLLRAYPDDWQLYALAGPAGSTDFGAPVTAGRLLLTSEERPSNDKIVELLAAAKRAAAEDGGGGDGDGNGPAARLGRLLRGRG